MADPPDKDELLELFRRLVPLDFSVPIEGDDSFALFRGLAETYSRLATKGNRSQQASYFLPHTSQSEAPASSGIRSSGTATFTRTGDLTRHLVAERGELRLAGRGGRFFTNAERIEWLPIDPPLTQKTVLFESEVTGFAGNLDHLSDGDGNLPLDRIEVGDQAQDRASDEGSIVALGGSKAIQDSGVPDVFIPDDVGLHVIINQATNNANEGRILKITGFDFPEVEFPVGSGRFPRRVFVDENEIVAPREAFQIDDSSSVVTDFTAESKNDASDDVTPFPSPPDTDDSFYVAALHEISGVRINVTTAAVHAEVLIWEYWTGAAWSALSVLTDPSDLFRIEGDHLITWDVPSDMAQTASALSGLTWFLVRVRVSGAPVFTTEPLFSRVTPRQKQLLITETESVTWSLLDFKDDNMALNLVSAQAFGGGRDDDLFLLGDGRKIYQQDNEDDETFRNRAVRLFDVVSPNAILRAVNRALRPFGLEGRAIDIDNGLTGIFSDEDFFDYFTAGDTSFVHGSALYVSTSNVALSGTPVIDGNLTVVGQVVLLVAQTTPSENGAYIVAAGAWSRDTTWGFDTGLTALNFITEVSSGTTYADTTWIVTGGDTIGVDPLTIPQLVSDAFPTDPFKLMLSHYEAYGHFLVVAPYMDLGEFGFSYDASPTILLPDIPTFLGGAFDSGFYDGTISGANALYSAIYSSVDAIRAGGVSFTLIRDESANALSAC
jgi:hypothetical protein